MCLSMTPDFAIAHSVLENVPEVTKSMEEKTVAAEKSSPYAKPNLSDMETTSLPSIGLPSKSTSVK